MREADKITFSPQSPALPRMSGKRVLVVEDDRTHRTLMEKILKESGFNAAQAENGIVALSRLDTGEYFDLIIMDWDMPALDGLATVREIRAREIRDGRPRTPVLAFTARQDPGDRESCIAAGMDAYLPKDVWMPKWRATLIENLQNLIKGNFNAGSAYEGAAADGGSADINPDALDMSTLEQTAALLKGEFAIAVDEYLEDTAAYIRNIVEGFEAGDAEKVARASHPLKSNSKGFGLTAVSQIAEAINDRARHGDLEASAPLAPQLQEAFRRAEKILRAMVRRACP